MHTVINRNYLKPLKAMIIMAGLIIAPASAKAALMVDYVSGDLVVSAFNDGINTTFDIRGQIDFNVSDPVAPIPLTQVTIGDITGGTDPTATVLPFGNQYLLGIDGTPGVAILAFFDFANLAFIGPDLLVPAYFGPLVGVPSAGGALEALLLGSPLPSSFQFLQSVNLGAGTLTQWSLAPTPNEVPEPGTAILMLIGLAACAGGAGLRRRSKAGNSAIRSA
jgi:PEP-CTERM motif